MKVIFGYFIEDYSRNIRFVKYNEDKFFTFEVKESTHALVNTPFGIRLMKICGYGEANELDMTIFEVIKFEKLELGNEDDKE